MILFISILNNFLEHLYKMYKIFTNGEEPKITVLYTPSHQKYFWHSPNYKASHQAS